MTTDLYWVPGPWKGRLAIVPRPRGGDWLEDEVRAWRAAGVDAVISALQSSEVEELDLGRENELCRLEGIDYVPYPLSDRGVPVSIRATAEFLRLAEKRLADGQTLVIHCRQGVGRSAVLGACLLVLSGLGTEDSFKRIEKARGCPVPDTDEQRRWVARFAGQVLAPS